MPAGPALHYDEWGHGATIVLVHGFTQSGSSWEPVAQRLADRWHLVAPDAPGHGRSAGMELGLWEAAGSIAATVGRAAYIGYSMGGRITLHLALARPELVEALVVVSATAGIRDPGERADRRAADEVLATRIETDGVEAFVEWWLRRPLFATLPRTRAGLDSRLGGTPRGLASSLRLAGTGAQEPLWDRLAELSMPVLVVAGALDVAYSERGREIAAAIGSNATLLVLPGAGHACHLEQPDAFSGAVGEWLTGVTDPLPR